MVDASSPMILATVPWVNKSSTVALEGSMFSIPGEASTSSASSWIMRRRWSSEVRDAGMRRGTQPIAMVEVSRVGVEVVREVVVSLLRREVMSWRSEMKMRTWRGQ